MPDAAAPSNSANGAMLSPEPTMIEVGSGRFVDLLNPDPATLELDDIARALAFTCRYGGHVKRFYSVAEHAVLVHDLLRWQGVDADLLKAALFHDAAEAYLGDVVSPLKYALRELESLPYGVYDELADRMDAALVERFGLDADALGSSELRTADMWALKIEAAALMHSGGAGWRWPGELPNGGQLPSGMAWRGGQGLAPDAAGRRWRRIAASLLKDALETTA